MSSAREPLPHLAVLCRGIGSGGSVANVALNEVRELASRFRVTVFSEQAASAPPQGARFVRVHARSFAWLRRFAHVPNELAFCRAVRKSVRALERSDPVDVFLCHSHTTAALVPPHRGGKRRTVLAMVTHGDIFSRPRGTYDPRLTRLYRWATPRAHRRCDLVVALSPAMREAAIRNGTAAERVRVIPNGVDLSEIGLTEPAAALAARSIPPLRILYVGRFSPEKGVPVLIDACGELHGRGLELQLTLAGDGPQVEECRERARRLGLESNAIFLGAVPRHALGEHYRRADVVCVPSLDEPLSTVLLEALAAGTPVVGSATGGTPFLVHDGENGCIVPPGDSRTLADCLHRLALNPGLLDRMAAAARSSVLPRFSWSKVGEELADEISAVLSHRR